MVRDLRLARAVVRAVDQSVLSAVELAERAGLTYSSLASWRMERRSPTLDNAIRIAEVLEEHAARVAQAAARLRTEVRRGSV